MDDTELDLLQSTSNRGEEVFQIQRNNISVGPGNFVSFPIDVDLRNYTSFAIHYFIDASMDVFVRWKAGFSDSNNNIENIIPIPSTGGGGTIGGIFTGSVKGQYLMITMQNTDLVPLTELKIFIYASH